MKKLLTIFLSLLICLSLSGCKEEIPNPMKQCESLDEINKLASVHLVSPGVVGVSDEEFYILDNNTAEYLYKVNGYLYYMRGTKSTNIDMSGIFENGAGLFEKQLEEKIAFGEATGYKVYRFILGDKQYIFGVKDEGKLDKSTFEIQFLETYNQVMFDSTIEEIKGLIGDYYDETSQRATLNFSLVDVNEVVLDIKWPSSADQNDEWIARCTYDGYKFIYNKDNIVHYRRTQTSDGEIVDEITEDCVDGYFEIKNKAIYWNGSNNAQTSNCIFKKAN